MTFTLRMRAAVRAALFHFTGSLLVAALAAVLVLYVWYPHPYGQLSGGLTLFTILVIVDVVCGPMLTLVLFNPKKPRRELVVDMSLVVFIQLAALVYGMSTVHQARPLFLVHEVDRFRVISMPDFLGSDVSAALEALDPSMKPKLFEGPVTVGIRDPRDSDERSSVMFESVAGGRDYSQRPEFYIPYDQSYQTKALARTRPLKGFVERYPDVASDATELLRARGVSMDEARFLPVLHKQEWIAVLDGSATILGFLPGDGFVVP